MKTVSVILTTYNAEKTLGRFLESVKNQEGLHEEFEIEWLVVDDCSTDNTTEVLKKHSIPFVVNEKNTGGPNKGRNKALAEASGDYITIADDDDQWDKNRLKVLLRAGVNTPIVTSGYRVINEKAEQKKAVNSNTGLVLYQQNETFHQLLQRSYKGQVTYLGSILFSSDIAIPRFETTYGKADWDWVLRLFRNQKSIEVCEILYTRYVEGENLSLNENYRKQELKNTLETLKDYEKEYPELVRKGKKNAYGSMARYYYLKGKMSKARYYLLLGGFTLKNALYYLTSYYGHSLVKRYFNVFG